jgi:RNA polymerase sigma-70 factor (ECF subfamily)
MAASNEIDVLLGRVRQGDRTAFDDLLPLVYPELHRIAERYFRSERPGHTLQPTALVHEAYLRLVNQRLEDCQNRAHFLGVAAFLMRRILVNHARGRQSGKRGNNPQAVSLDDAMAVSEQRADDVLAIDQALSRLTDLDPEQARLVEMHFFGGMTFDEIAEVLAISVPTVKRRWASARAWLSREFVAPAQAQRGNPGH